MDLALANLNGYHNNGKNEQDLQLTFFDGKNYHEDKRNIFPHLSMKGFNLRMTTLPSSYQIITSTLPQPQSPRHLYGDHQGTGVQFLRSICKLMGMTMTIENPEVLRWETDSETK
jgi:hypothetical protein